MKMKDEVIFELGRKGNVAQFVSFDESKNERFRLIQGRDDYEFRDHREAIEALFYSSPAGTVNIRTFRPEDSQTPEFLFGIDSAQEAIEKMEKFAADGLYTIVHETIPLDDGGVSGIVQNGIVEFAPGVTPRFVEDAADEPARMTLQLAKRILTAVYGFRPDIDVADDVRLEFSVHPQKCGYAKRNTIVWEHERLTGDRVLDCSQFLDYPVNPWPNSFSKHIGDKAYGLIVANALDIDVPFTTVHVRSGKINMFSFGATSSDRAASTWTRTCPIVQEPGLYSTVKDCLVSPYELMDMDDPAGDKIASCLLQDGIEALYSGSTITSSDGTPIVEGVEGFGDAFMTGDVAVAELPSEIVSLVLKKYREIEKVLGDVRFEWAYDGQRVWILQLHMGATVSTSTVIYPGDFDQEVSFKPSDGLPVLRSLINDVVAPGQGIVVRGHIGVTSHVADVLRKAKIPSRIETNA